MTKEEWIKRYEKIRPIIGILCLILAPCVSYALFEYVTGNLAQISFFMAALNVGWILAVYLLLFVISGSTRIAVPIGAAAFYAMSLAETFVVDFRARPIMIWDVMSVGTAMSVAGNYTFAISRPMAMAGVCAFLLAAVSIACPFRLKGKKVRLSAFFGGTAAVSAFVFWFYSFAIPHWNFTINMWEFAETYNECGYVLSTAVSGQYLVKKKPESYKTSVVTQLAEEYKEAEETEHDGRIQPVNLICIMNESFSDLRSAGDFETNQEYLSFYNSLSENTVKGKVIVPIFGSMTSNSEYEFLTGNSMSQLPTSCIAYQFLVRNNTPGLVETLKSQGYEAVAMHPYPADNWNRRECYANMGFNLFLDETAYEGSEQLRNYVSDRGDYEKLIEMVENKENPEDRLFLFNVTMQNHGGYEETHDNFNQEVWLTGELEGKFPKTDQYLSLMKESDEALEYLISYFEECEEPTMIVLFGDHQPSVEDEFFDIMAGQPSSEVPVSEKFMWYETPYLIWTNYESEAEETGHFSALYLSSEMLSRAGLSMTPYNRFLLEMKEEVPVLHPFGCEDADGVFYTWPEITAAGSPHEERMLEYEYLVYNFVYANDTVDAMFRLN